MRLTGPINAATNAEISVRNTIAETPATTLAGLKFKVKYAAAHCEGAYDAEVVTSIVDDLLAKEG